LIWIVSVTGISHIIFFELCSSTTLNTAGKEESIFKVKTDWEEYSWAIQVPTVKKNTVAVDHLGGGRRVGNGFFGLCERLHFRPRNEFRRENFSRAGANAENYRRIAGVDQRKDF
jgi:hypothetical protein